MLASCDGLKFDAPPAPEPLGGSKGPTACLNYIDYNFHLGIFLGAAADSA